MKSGKFTTKEKLEAIEKIKPILSEREYNRLKEFNS